MIIAHSISRRAKRQTERVPHSLRGLQRVREARMKNRLERWYGQGHLHFITCSCYRRKPLLGRPQARDVFLKILAKVRDRYDFALVGMW